MIFPVTFFFALDVCLRPYPTIVWELNILYSVSLVCVYAVYF